MFRTLVSLCVLLSASAGAQSFEVAVIKLSQPANDGRQFTGFQTPGGGRLNTINTPLRSPSWANSEAYDITAKAQGGATMDQLRLMVQALLMDRFKLVIRHETKDAPIYELMVAKGGSKIQEDTASAKSRLGMTGPGKFTAQKASLATFAQLLGTLVGRPVVDKTGLASTYTFRLDWTPEVGEGGPRGPGAQDVAPPDPSGPSLFTALQEQLGLRLQSGKGAVLRAHWP